MSITSSIGQTLSWPDIDKIDQEQKQQELLKYVQEKVYHVWIDFINPVCVATKVTLPYIVPVKLKNTDEENKQLSQEKKLDELVRLGIPFKREALKAIRDFIRAHKSQLCEREITYPAKFKGFITAIVNNILTQSLFFIEVHNKKAIHLILKGEDFDVYIGGGVYKQAYKVWNIARPQLLAYVESSLKVDTLNEERPEVLACIAEKEEKYLHLFNGSKRMPHVYALFWNSDYFVSIMDYYAEGDLLNFLNGVMGVHDAMKIYMTDRQKIEFAIEIVTAVADMHSKRVVHKDIKPDNLLKDQNSIVLTDFGFACSFDNLEDLKRKQGSLPYVACEQLVLPKALGPSLDMWGVGCILYILFAERPYPWYELLSQNEAAIRRGTLNTALRLMDRYHHVSIPENHKVACLVHHMLHLNPKKRICASDALEKLNQLLKELPSEDAFSLWKQFKDSSFYYHNIDHYKPQTFSFKEIY